MFERVHHRRIERVLRALNAQLLRDANCLFGGGTALALRFGEYRESVDMDFLVSDIASYRLLRQRLAGSAGFNVLLREGAETFQLRRELRADQYGIRTQLLVDQQPIKFEIVLEARFTVQKPKLSDCVAGIACLTTRDLATSKLLANTDRWRDDSVFSRDVIDLAMMRPKLPLLRDALATAQSAYGDPVTAALQQAIDNLESRKDWLERCLQAMAITLPKAVVWQHIRSLRRGLA